jgi:CubicO group peptidase (beta-lactamase class C family)
MGSYIVKLIHIVSVAALTLSPAPSILYAFQGPPDVAELAAEARQNADAPALGLVVVRPGAEPQIAVDGVRIFGDETLVTAEDEWHWGSITKSMTATLVARLVGKGVVSWDDTVGDRLGKLVPDMNDDFRDATFKHLLSHRAGLAANIPLARFADFGQTPDDPIADRLKWVQIALTQTPVGPKETTFLYSNNGFIVAGAMLEAATGDSWETLMEREVFSPLGLTSAGFGPPQGPNPDDQPRGHRPAAGGDKAVPLNADNPAALGPAGRVHMSLADMAKFLLMHAQQPQDFLQPESFDILHTPPFGGNYAMGWVVIGPQARWHNGSNNMWYAEATFNLSDGAVAAVVVNDGDIAHIQTAVRTLLRTLMKPTKSQ